MLVNYRLPAQTDSIPGLYAAKQKRSIEIRDAYIREGIKMLNSLPLDKLRVPDIAEKCGYSVGSFYTRFKDKDAFFLALRAAVLEGTDRLIDTRVSSSRIKAMPVGAALDEMVDLMVDIFSGDGRGVFRESLIRILEPDDLWGPMRNSALRIIKNYQNGLSDRFPSFGEGEAKKRISFCFQTVVGVLQNDLINDHHVYSTRDETIGTALKDMIRRYMAIDPNGPSTEALDTPHGV